MSRLSELLQRRRWLLLLLGFVAIEAVYVFFVSAGRLTHWPTYLTFLDDQAEGFRGGHLHLAIEPPAALLAKANPFDPAWKPLWYWDASLYNGHYYLYWGPVPALLLAGWKTLLRVHARVGDQYVVFVLASLQALAGMLLIDRARRRLFPALPGIFVALAVAVFAFANPTLYNLARAGVYEAAIVGGHAFLICGLLFAFHALTVGPWKGPTPPAKDSDERSSSSSTRSTTIGPGQNITPAAASRHRLHLALAGVCWALALGCRVSIAPGVGALAAVTCWLTAPRGPERWRRRARALAWLAAPLALGVALLLAHNKLRFDAWLDFGRHYQLSWIQFGSSASYLAVNAWSYALRPLAVGCRFPFLYGVTDMGARAFPGWLHVPDGYIVYEPVVGCVLALPWAWLAPVTAVSGVRRLWALARGRAPADAEVPAVALTWLAVATTAAAVASFAVPLTLFWATMRFLGDAAPALTLAGTVGWWLCHARFHAQPSLRRLVASAAVALALVTVLIGAALAFEGQYKHFRLHNPALLDRLEKMLSFC